MKRFIVFAIILFSFENVGSQTLGQDKDGFSSIILPSSTFNLDLSGKVATLNYYRESPLSDYSEDREYNTEEMCLLLSKTEKGYRSMLARSWKRQEEIFKKKTIVYGIDLKGASSDGLSLLVNNEQLTSNSTISGLIGVRWQKRKYDFRNIREYAKISYNYRFENEEETTYIERIEIEVDKLLAQGLITEGKKEQLLNFTMANSIESKIRGVEAKIQSIVRSRGFLNQSEVEQELKKRIEVLNEIKSLVSKINTNVQLYNAKMASIPINQNAVFQGLTDLKNNIKDFEKLYESKEVKPLELQLNYKDYKKASTWNAIDIKIDETLETTGFELYLLKKRDGMEISSAEVIKAYESYLNYLKEDKLSFDHFNKKAGQTYSIQKNLVYLKGGFVGTSFKYDTANDSSSISERFINKDFQGYRFELGYTRQWKRYNFLGFNFAMNSTFNVDSLASTTYKFETVDASVTPNVTTSQEFEALSGDFDTFLKYGISIDYVHLFPFHDSNASDKEIKDSKLMLSLNPYLRHYFYNGADGLKPNTSIGVGVYSFNKNNGSIAGGIFIQADDVFNVANDEDSNLSNRISFGIVFKVAIKSFDPAS